MIVDDTAVACRHGIPPSWSPRGRYGLALVLLLALLALSAAPVRADDTATAAPAQPAEPSAAQDAPDDTAEIIVKYHPGTKRADRADARDDAGVDREATTILTGAEVVTVPAEDLGEALDALRADPSVTYAAGPAEFRALSADPQYNQQWALANTGQSFSGFVGIPGADMKVAAAWQAAPARGAGVLVGVVDTGAEAAHDDLAGKVTGGRSFVTGVGSYDDDTTPSSSPAYSHGTHVSGIIAAAADNNVGIAGVAPGARLVELKALDESGVGSSRSVGDALAYAGDLGLPIVNVSLGVDSLDADNVAFLENVIASHPNTLYVVAAGNDDADLARTPEFPCSLPAANIVCVGGSTSRDERAAWSNYGTDVDLFAPGQQIVSTWKPDAYNFSDGTSMAAPMVSAVAALVLAQHPGLRAASLKQIVTESVDRPATLAGLAATSGRANALAAVTRVPADRDGDGLLDALDACPDVAGVGENGCAPSRAKVAGVLDADRDGRADQADACPATAASTANGCPLAKLRSLRVTVRHRGHRSAAVRLRADRRAQAALRVERRVCSRGRCRWSRLVAKTLTLTGSGIRTLTVRRGRRALVRGTYRVSVALTTGAGRSRPVVKRFLV